MARSSHSRGPASASPLPSPAVDRTRLHVRAVTYEGYQRSDELFDIEGHLLDVKDAELMRGQYGEQPGRDPRPVTAGQGHQDDGPVSIHRG